MMSNRSWIESGLGPVGELGTRPFSIWMAQRAIDFYGGLEDADRAHADGMIEATGLRPFFDLSPGFRIERLDHQEWLVVAAKG